MKMQSFIPVRLSRMLDLARKAKRALKVQLQTCSICNGEQVAGFKDTQSGHFFEIMLIRNGQDLDSFMEMYELSSVTKEY